MLLDDVKKIYFIGIKGVGMTMLAQFLHKRGLEIIGSDTEEKFMTDKVLSQNNIFFYEEFSEVNIPQDVDLIIYSEAYNLENNIEVETALEKKIKTINYGQALGEIFNTYDGIAVCGSHGKTTTSAWLGWIMKSAKLDPNVLVGSMVPQFQGNSLVGKSNYLIAETDEYGNKLKYFFPKIVLLNNIDYDHPDFFSCEEEYKKVFIDFIRKIPKDGFLVANFNDQNISHIVDNNSQVKTISYAISENNEINQKVDYLAYDIRQDNEYQKFRIKLPKLKNNNELGEFKIQLLGDHNISNALAIVATSIELKISLDKIKYALKSFLGTARRMEKLGEYKNAIIIDDYAHHPTEIKTTLNGLKKKYPEKNIVVVFHPHTFTRTKIFFNEFARSFQEADEIIILDIYGSAREKAGGVSSMDLVQKMKKIEHNARKKIQNINTLKEAEDYLRKNLKTNDVLLLMGAGDVFRIGENLVN